jgi:hypothetical protein
MLRALLQTSVLVMASLVMASVSAAVAQNYAATADALCRTAKGEIFKVSRADLDRNPAEREWSTTADADSAYHRCYVNFVRSITIMDVSYEDHPASLSGYIPPPPEPVETRCRWVGSDLLCRTR